VVGSPGGLVGVWRWVGGAVAWVVVVLLVWVFFGIDLLNVSPCTPARAPFLPTEMAFYAGLHDFDYEYCTTPFPLTPLLSLFDFFL